MGCSSSKRVEATVADVYRPPPSSFAVFDITKIQEPWLSLDDKVLQEQREKATHVPAPILEKLNKFETDAPHSWDEVSKDLEDLKPTLDGKITPVTSEKPAAALNPPAQLSTAAEKKQTTPRKSATIHTLEELDAKLSSKPETQLRKTESMRTELKKTEVHNKIQVPKPAPESGNVIRPVKENIFIVRDRLEREKEGKQANYEKLMQSRRDPLSEFPEKCPPGGADTVVIYTTSLRGVRKTYEDCCKALEVLEGHRVVCDERDVSLHGEFLNELKELVDGESVSVPRVFVKGRYIGGVEKLVELDESGRLGRILSWARVERGMGRQGCQGCGGARFVPCLNCGGSCKVLVNGVKERCGMCNENGLVLCPACHH